jgi:TonB family protein
MPGEPAIRLLVDLDPEAARWRWRTMFLVSVILHALLIGFILASPQIFRRGAELMGMNLEPQRKPEFTYLWIPPEVLKKLTEPPPETNIFSDRDRRAQGRSPVIDPNGLRMPYSPGNTPLPEIPGGAPSLPPPAAAPAPMPGTASPPTPKKEEGLRLRDVEPLGEQSAGLQLPNLTPGQAIQESLQEAIRNRGTAGSGSGAAAGPGDSMSEFQNYHPNFSTEAPLILSDTRGVDFGPYLARVVYIVRRNWYSIIPESARLGERGRVAIVFEILKDGAVPQLRLVASSGADALDRAALAGIRASIPFPPLPEAFTGNHLVLQFIFLYNMTLGP